MFMVINKDKIISYLVSLGTVTFLFVMSFVITNNNDNDDRILQTSTNINSQNIEIIKNETIINSNNLIKKDYNIIGEN